MNRNLLFIACAIALYFGLKKAYGKRNGSVSDMPNKAFMWASVAHATGFILGTPHWGSKIPGSFFERAEYKGMFYVNLFPGGQEVKSYRVPALISASAGSDTYYDNNSYYWREYHIELAAMPNGGNISFYNADGYLELGKAVTIFDDAGRYWKVELTNKPAK